MKKIISVLGLVLVIGALTATSALAVVPSERNVKAPNNGQVGNGGNSFGNAPDRHVVTCVPNNQGTSNAAGNSPAIGSAGCSINNF
jgi:hypothetical protein